MSRLVLVAALVLLALASAGCTSTPTNGTGATTPASVVDGASQITYTPQQARALLADAARDFPPEFGFDMKLTNGSQEVIVMKGLFDNSTKTSYVELKMDPTALGSAAGGADSTGASTFFSNGMTIYTTPHASVWIVNDTAFAIPPDEGGSSKGMFGGSDPTSAFKDLSDPQKLFANFTGNEAKENQSVIKSVTPTVYRGRPAISIVGATVKNGTSYEATIVLYTGPARPAHIEGSFPPEEGKSKGNDLFSKGKVTMDFYYGSEVTTKVPSIPKRGLGLAYKSDGSTDYGAASSNWTFLVSGGIPTSEVSLEVKDASNSTHADPTAAASVGQLPTLWSMKLSDVTATKNGVTLTFDDKDHDAKVSAGDRVTISWPTGAERPNVVLHDSVSGLYVVPGGSALVALAALGAVAFALRRR